MALMANPVAWIGSSRRTMNQRNEEREALAGELAALKEKPSVRTALARLRALREQRGVTLVEVLIVVAIIAMVAGGVTVFALPKYREAQLESAKTNARTIRNAIMDWQRVNNEVSCPTISQLVQEKHIDTAAEIDDPWGEDYGLNCTEDEVYVSSKGPDKKKGTKDDIQIPKGSTEG